MTYNPYPQIGPINAVARFIMGLFHDDAHLDQLRDIMKQAHAVHTH
jgi:hypothetical protein